MTRLLAVLGFVVLAACGSSSTGGVGGGSGGGTGGAGGGSDGGTNTNPIARFTATRVTGDIWTFDASASSDPNGDPITLSWFFGPGSRGSGPVIAHLFTADTTVILVADDGRGGSHTITREITVTRPGAMGVTAVTFRVRDARGVAVAGASVENNYNSGAIPTNAQGQAGILVGTAVPIRVRVTKAGFVPQVRVITVPAGNPIATFEVRLVPRAPAIVLADSAAGGTITGLAGVSVTLPPNALRMPGGGGSAIDGPVNVFLTSIDPVASPELLPGTGEGLDTLGARTPVRSAGTVHFAFEKGSVPVELIPGKEATVELPLPATLKPDSSPLAVGAAIGLWSLDESSGLLVLEGEGLVVAGQRLRGRVGHFSFWNSAFSALPSDRKPRCVDGTGAAVACWVRASTHCTPDFGMCDPNPPATPGWTLDAFLPPMGATMRVPASTDTWLVAYSADFTQRGSVKTQNLPADPQDVLLTLQPIPVSVGTDIAIPSSTTATLTAPSQIDTYHVDALAGDFGYFQVQRTANACQGTLTVTSATGRIWGPSIFGRPPPAGSARKDAFVGLKFPTSGRYVVQVVCDAAPTSVPCPYTLVATASANYPIVIGESPAYGATQVSVTTLVGLTYSQPLRATSVTATSLQLETPFGGPQEQPSFTPPATVALDAGLYGGLEYRLIQYTSVTAVDGGSSQIPYSVPFATQETVGKASPVHQSFDLTSIATNSAGQAFVGLGSRIVDYLPGVGWKRYVSLTTLTNLNSLHVASRQADRATACYAQTYSVFANHRTAEGWGPSTRLNTPEQLADTCRLTVDSQDRAVVSFSAATDAGFVMMVVRSAPDGGTWAAPEVARAPAADFIDTWDHASSPAGHQVIAWRGSNMSSPSAIISGPAPAMFGAETVVDLGPAYAVRAAIDDSGNVMVIYTMATGFWARRYDAATSTWQPKVNLGGSVYQSFTYCSNDLWVTALPPNDFLVAGCEFDISTPTSRPIFAARYSDAAAAFQPKTILATGFLASQITFGASTEGNVVIGWKEIPANRGFYKRFGLTTGWDASATDIDALPTGLPLTAGSPAYSVAGNTLLGWFGGQGIYTYAWSVRLP